MQFTDCISLQIMNIVECRYSQANGAPKPVQETLVAALNTPLRTFKREIETEMMCKNTFVIPVLTK